jgi:hypothetical protein
LPPGHAAFAAVPDSDRDGRADEWTEAAMSHGHDHHHDHHQDHDGPAEVPAVLDPAVPDGDLSPGELSRRGLLRNAGLRCEPAGGG